MKKLINKRVSFIVFIGYLNKDKKLIFLTMVVFMKLKKFKRKLKHNKSKDFSQSFLVRKILSDNKII